MKKRKKSTANVGATDDLISRLHLSAYPKSAQVLRKRRQLVRCWRDQPGTGLLVGIDRGIYNANTAEGLRQIALRILGQDGVTSRATKPPQRQSPVEPGAHPSQRPAIRLAAVLAVVRNTLRHELAAYQDSLWLPLTAPYRASRRLSGDTGAALSTLHSRYAAVPVRSADELAQHILADSGLGRSFGTAMNRLQAAGPLDMLPDLWPVLVDQSLPRPSERLRALVDAGICPPPERSVGTFVHKATVLFGHLVAMTLEQDTPRRILTRLVGESRRPEDGQVLKRVAQTAQTYGTADAQQAMARLLEAWDEVDAAPADAGAWHAVQVALGHLDVGVPDEVLRSLLEAALRQARERRVYALPDVKYWVQVPDRLLANLGIERLTLSAGAGENLVQTAPQLYRFPLGSPSPGVTGAALFLATIAALAYSALVTRREQFHQEPYHGGALYHFPAHVRPGGAHQPQARAPIRVARTWNLPGSRHAGQSSRPTGGSASYVIPHLRRLIHQQASAGASAAAAEHGLRLPAGYTFVRGYLRGEGPLQGPVAYTLVDVALETIRRCREAGR